MLDRSDVMLQEFCSELALDGELSFIFFGRQFSHLVRKIPSEGDYRTQKEYAATFLAEVPNESILAQASAALEFVKGDLLYARVDGVVLDEVFTIVEIELIEPWLMLEHDKLAPQRFADSILERLP